MKTIIDTITAAGNYKTLLAVLKTASFMDTLRTLGPMPVTTLVSEGQ